jgi:type IV conjugative transfer system protein TraE
MDTKVVIESVDRIARQRNLFLALTLLLSASLLLLSLRLVTFDQRVVLVPGLNQEMSVSGRGVSSSYLEQMALLFLSNLLDISEVDLKHKRDLVLKYTSHSDATYSRQITEYFATAEHQYKKFDLATHFTVKNMRVNQKNLEVIASGILTSWYGKKGHETREISYQISFDYSGGFLRLKEFGAVAKDEK